MLIVLATVVLLVFSNLFGTESGVFLTIGTILTILLVLVLAILLFTARADLREIIVEQERRGQRR